MRFLFLFLLFSLFLFPPIQEVKAAPAQEELIGKSHKHGGKGGHHHGGKHRHGKHHHWDRHHGRGTRGYNVNWNQGNYYYPYGSYYYYYPNYYYPNVNSGYYYSIDPDYYYYWTR